MVHQARGYSRERGHFDPSPSTETFLTATSLNSQIPNFDPEQSFPSYLIHRCIVNCPQVSRQKLNFCKNLLQRTAISTECSRNLEAWNHLCKHWSICSLSVYVNWFCQLHWISLILHNCGCLLQPFNQYVLQTILIPPTNFLQQRSRN